MQISKDTYFSKFYSQKAIVLYFILLLICSAVFINRVLPFIWIISGVLEIVLFFYFLNYLSKKWIHLSEKIFLRRIFITALIIRVCYVIFSYFFYLKMTGQPFEFSAGDALFYHNFPSEIADVGLTKAFILAKNYRIDISDMGQPLVVATLYTIFGKVIIIPRILNAILSSWMCILLYRFANRNFGEMAAHNTAIIAMLLPNFIYYCGLHLKETNMIFLVVLFMERADYVLRGEKIKISTLIVPVLVGAFLFFFRTVLAASLWLAFFSALIFTSRKVGGWKKRILVVFWFLIAAFFIFSGKIEKDLGDYWSASSNNQSINMKSRADRKGGNTLSEKGSVAIFAPMILVAPFPTFVNVDGQDNQMYQNGSYVVKNIMAFFVIMALLSIIFIYKTYKYHVLLLAFVASYLGIISMSSFALSERFHLPTLPFLVLLAGFGITQINAKRKKLFIPYLILIAIVIIGWNWFKLAGRGAA
ncbi:MAG: hypothetical protein P4L28_00615 [Paludibacteraceae bacterium]|nr:hypothetical protein [Paludibacteraceae bacterium]